MYLIYLIKLTYKAYKTELYTESNQDCVVLTARMTHRSVE